MNPRLFRWSSSSASLYSPLRIRRKTFTMPTSTSRLSTPSRIRKVPDTETPMMPVTECSPESPFSTWPASAFTPRVRASASRNTIEEWPSENQNPTDRGLRASSAAFLGLGRHVLGHQLAGGVVDGGDVICVEGVPQSEGVSQDADADVEHRVLAAEGEIVRHDQEEQRAEPDDVQQRDEAEHP